MTTKDHRQGSTIPTQFRDCSFTEYSAPQAVLVVSPPTTHPDRIDFVNCSFSGNELFITDGTLPESVVRFQDSQRGSIAARPASVAGGTAKLAWNAKVFGIAPFA